MGNQASTLHQAASTGDLAQLQVLASKQDHDCINSQDSDGWTPLHFAAWKGHASIVQELLQRGASHSVTDKARRTPLHMAALGGSEAVAKLLIDAGASLDARDSNNLTALHKAVTQSHEAMAQLLLQRGADVIAELSDGTTPVMLAAWKGQVALVDMLVQHGANLQAVNVDGQSVLHEAAAAGHEGVVQLLLSYGMDPSLRDKDGSTAAELATKGGHEAVANLISQSHASMATQAAPAMPALAEYAQGGPPRWPPAPAADGERPMEHPETASAPPLPGFGDAVRYPELFGSAAAAAPGQAGVSGWDALQADYAQQAQQGPQQAQHAHSERATEHARAGVRLVQEAQQQALQEARGAGLLLQAASPVEGTPVGSDAVETQQQQQPPQSLVSRVQGVIQQMAARLQQVAAQHSVQHSAQHSAAQQAPAGATPAASSTGQQEFGDWGSEGNDEDDDDWGGLSAQGNVPRLSSRRSRTESRGKDDGACESDDSDDYEDAPRGVVGARQRVHQDRSFEADKEQLAARLIALEQDIDKQNGWVRGGGKASQSAPAEPWLPLANPGSAAPSLAAGQGVAGVSDPDLDLDQQERLLRQGNEIAALKRQLEALQLQSAAGTSPPNQIAFPQCQTYSYAEVYQATAGFSEANRLGTGGLGIVYRGSLAHTPVAVKILDPQGLEGAARFAAEVEVLSRMRHPHILLLLGACPESGCLVYELMQNGSVEDALRGRRPHGSSCAVRLDWSTRTRIACEMATALLFLHTARPQVLHRNFKPANILLDRNMTSKLGDVGLARLAPDQVSGTGQTIACPAFLDPECSNGRAYTPASDVYALGITLLQLLTGREPEGIVGFVAAAAQRKMLQDVVDPCAGGWPLEDATAVAQLALRCTQPQPQDRPDLGEEVLAELSRLAGRAEAISSRSPLSTAHARLDRSYSRAGSTSDAPPAMFLCPITQDIMADPCVAADGYTYEREAIQQWFAAGHLTSPMTNLILPHAELTPNHALRSAALEWQEAHRKGSKP